MPGFPAATTAAALTKGEARLQAAQVQWARQAVPPSRFRDGEPPRPQPDSLLALLPLIAATRKPRAGINQGPLQGGSEVQFPSANQSQALRATPQYLCWPIVYEGCLQTAVGPSAELTATCLQHLWI